MICLVNEAIDVNAVVASVLDPTAGGLALFIGTTRDSFTTNDGVVKSVVQLEYEAYQPMAIKEMSKIATLAREKWPELTNISFVHRLGIVPVMEASIVIAVSSPHRTDALAAVPWMTDQLKHRVPIFKREVYLDGSEWKQNDNSKKGCCEH